MQVRKFEARTMKEALDLVKAQMGPEAIILSARDHSRGFGLVGQGSVEITAAISETELQKRKIAEAKLRETDKEKLRKTPAKTQKKFIESAISRYQTGGHSLDMQSRKYVDILDEEETSPPAVMRATSPEVSNNEVDSLRTELAQLKKTLAQFQSVPQTFVGQHPGADYELPYEMSHCFEKLTQVGISSEIAGSILQLAKKQMPPIKYKSKALVDAWVARYFLDHTLVVAENSAPRVQLFAGPAGSGKTSSMVKLAARYVVQDKKKVALVTTDSFKIGAAEQLKIYAQILNIPFALIRNQNDWRNVLTQLSSYDYILCDMPGLSLKGIDDISLIRSLLPPDEIKHTTHLVLSATAKDLELAEIGKRYKVAHFDDVIFTSLDETILHGTIYNFMHTFQVPLHSFGIGSKTPEDYEMATRERVLDLIFKLSGSYK